MIDVSDHRHVPDIGFNIHDLTDLVYREIHLKGESKSKIYKQGFGLVTTDRIPTIHKKEWDRTERSK